MELSAVVHALSEYCPTSGVLYEGPKVTTVRAFSKDVDVSVGQFMRMASAALQPYGRTTVPYAAVRSPTPARFIDELVLYIQIVKEDGTVELVPSEPVSPRV